MSNWAYIYINRIYQLYELEYKLSQLEAKAQKVNYESTEAFVYRIKIKIKLERVAKDLISDFLQVFYSVFDTYLAANSMEREAERVEQYIDILKKAKNETLQQQIIALNSTIWAIHSGELQIIGMSLIPENDREDTQGYGDEGIWLMQGRLGDVATKGFLNSLTKGDFINQWDKEIEKRATIKANWYKIAQIKWEPSIDNNDAYLHLGDEPDASLIPIDNVFIPSGTYNPVYKETMEDYLEQMTNEVSVYPPHGTVHKELTPNIYREMVNHKFWQPISNTPQYGKPYANIYDGVHRTLAAQAAGAEEIKVIRDLGRSSEWF